MRLEPGEKSVTLGLELADVKWVHIVLGIGAAGQLPPLDLAVLVGSVADC